MRGSSSCSSRGRRLPMVFMLLAIAVTMAVAIGVALGGGTAVAKKPPKAQATSDATIEATTFKVADHQDGEEYAKCPANKRVVGGGVVQSGPPNGLVVLASGPLDETGTTAQTQSGDTATQWYAAVQALTQQADVNLKVFAICE
jgi:hypothetical protein